MRKYFILVVVFLTSCILAQGGEIMRISSPHFVHQARIPKQFTCDGSDISPELHIHDIPKNTQSLVLIVDDPDAPVGTWVHWVVYDIDPVEVIAATAVPGTQGMNDFRRTDYGGPCPPFGTHRYFFKLYALDTRLNAKEGLTKKQVLKIIKGHILAEAQLVGVYSRSR